MISIKRIYEKPVPEDGYRVLVDRLWPRGLSKKEASIDLWLKEIAPDNELRKWFAHDPDKWDDFKRKYKTVLEAKTKITEELARLITEHETVTLLYAAKDEAHNNAVALREFLEERQ